MIKQSIGTALVIGLLAVGFSGCGEENANVSGDSGSSNVTLTTLPYTVEDNINLISENTKDEFKVTLEVGDYAINVKLLPGTSADGHNLVIEVYNDSDVKIASIDQNSLSASGDNEDLSFYATTKGAYTIKVTRKYNTDATYKFTLYPSIKNGLVQDEKNEYNNFKAMATPLTYQEANSGVSGDLNLLVEDTRDWYSVDLNKTGTYALSIELLPGTSADGYNLNIGVYNESDEKIASLDQNSLQASGQAERFTFDANTKGVYKILFSRNNNTDAFYKFRLFQSTENGLVQNSEYEFNDFKEMATPLTYTQMSNDINSSLNVTNTDKSDWYSVELESGTYNINAELLAGTVSNGYNLTIKILDTQNEQIALLDKNSLDAEGNTESLSFNALLSGTYKIQFRRNYDTTVYYKYNLIKG